MKCDVVNCFPTNQKVTGSNPVGRAKQKALKHKRFKAFSYAQKQPFTTTGSKSTFYSATSNKKQAFQPAEIGLFHTLYESFHSFCAFPAHLVGNMGVYIACCANFGVSQRL